MNHRSRTFFDGSFMLALLLFGLSTASVNAQSASPLPTAPGAERVGEGGLTQGHPSVPAAPGMSPLEPYLIIWLLPVSGILTALAGVFVSQGMLKRNPRRTR